MEKFGACDDEEGGYDLILKKTASAADGDDFDPRDLHITVTLPAGAVKLPCGAVNAEPVSEDICFEPHDVSAEEASPTALIAANDDAPSIDQGWEGYADVEYYIEKTKDLLNQAYNILGAVSRLYDDIVSDKGVNPFSVAQIAVAGASAVLTVLEMCGVFPRGLTLEDVYYTVMQTQTMIRELSDQMQDMYNHMDERLDAAERREQKIIYASAQNNWNGFIDGVYKEMRGQIDAFQSAYNSALLKGLLTKNDFTFDLKYEELEDEKGNTVYAPTLEGAIAGYGLMGGRIDDSKTVTITLNGGFPNTVNRLARAGSMYADFEQDFQKEFVTKYCDATLEGVEENDKLPYNDKAITVNGKKVPFYEVYSAIRLYFIKEAVGVVGATKFMSTYNAYCRAVAGNGGSSPLDYLTTMMGACYNFYPEAKRIIATYYFDVLSLTSQASTLAYFMQLLSGLTSGGNKQTLKNSSQAVQREFDRQKYNYELRAQESMDKAYEDTTAEHNQIFSFVTQSFIKTAERKVVLLTNWDGQNGNRTQQTYGYYKKQAVGSNDDTLGQGVTADSMAENRVSLDQVRAIAGRMSISAKEVKTGETTGGKPITEIKKYSRLTEYLYDFAHVVPGGKECTKRILCGYPSFRSTETQSALMCYALDTNRGRWLFQVWKYYPVNRTAKYERREYTAKYFRTHTILTGDVFEDNRAQSNVTLLELSTYCERYWAWTHEEIAAFAGGKWDMDAAKAGDKDAANLSWHQYSYYNFRVRAYITMDCQVILQSASSEYTPQKAT